jgi:hypothetical protein
MLTFLPGASCALDLIEPRRMMDVEEPVDLRHVPATLGDLGCALRCLRTGQRRC